MVKDNNMGDASEDMISISRLKMHSTHTLLAIKYQTSKWDLVNKNHEYLAKVSGKNTTRVRKAHTETYILP